MIIIPPLVRVDDLTTHVPRSRVVAIGPTQMIMVERARTSLEKTVIPGIDAALKACRRLVCSGVFTKLHVKGIHVFKLTPLGMNAWLVVLR